MVFSPPHSSELILAFPSPHVLLLTLNRPDALNSVTVELANELCAVLDWFEREKELWTLVLTGAGRMFCAGADLKGWDNRLVGASSSDQADISANNNGFASISRRLTAKPIIAAVNGGAYGGGMEILLNCDLVVADENAKFAFPEVRRGVAAIQGGIPRLAQTAGHQRASEMLLLGKTITARDAYERFGFINKLTPLATVLTTALEYAKEIVEKCSPDAVQATKRALILAEYSNQSVLEAVWSAESNRLFEGANLKEGLRAFVEKRSPIWKNPGANAKLPSFEIESDTYTETESTLSPSASSQPEVSDTESDWTASSQVEVLTPQTGDIFVVNDAFMRFVREISDKPPDSLHDCIAGLLFLVFVSLIIVTVYSRRPPPCNWWCQVQTGTIRVPFPTKWPF